MSNNILFIFEGQKPEKLITNSLTNFFVNESTIITCAYCTTIYKIYKVRVLINVDGQWQEGTFRFVGDGLKIVEPHVEVNVPTGTSAKRIFVTKQTVLRWWD